MSKKSIIRQEISMFAGFTKLLFLLMVAMFLIQPITARAGNFSEQKVNNYNPNAYFSSSWDDAENYICRQIRGGAGMVDFWINDKDNDAKETEMYITAYDEWQNTSKYAGDYIGSKTYWGGCPMTSPYPNGTYLIFYTGTWFSNEAIPIAENVVATAFNEGIKVTWTTPKAMDGYSVMWSANKFSWSYEEVPAGVNSYVINRNLEKGKTYYIHIYGENDNTWSESADVEVVYNGKGTQSFSTSSVNISNMCPGSKGSVSANGAKTPVTFESKDPSIATVDGNGKITAVAKGETQIVITATANAEYLATSKSVTVKVGDHAYNGYSNPDKLNRVEFDFSRDERNQVTCTAAKVCSRCNHKETIPCTVTTRVSKKATPKDSGELESKAVAMEKGYEYVQYDYTSFPGIFGIKMDTSSFTYTGSSIKPSVYIKDYGSDVIAPSHYKLSYSNNKNVGTAKVIAVFKSAYYEGKLSATFKITPKMTTITSLKAASKAITVKWTKLSSGTATGYQIQCSLAKNFKKSSTKTTDITSYKTSSTKVKGLKGKKTYYVRIRTYKTVNGKKIYAPWSPVKTIKTKK